MGSTDAQSNMKITLYITTLTMAVSAMPQHLINGGHTVVGHTGGLAHGVGLTHGAVLGHKVGLAHGAGLAATVAHGAEVAAVHPGVGHAIVHNAPIVGHSAGHGLVHAVHAAPFVSQGVSHGVSHGVAHHVTPVIHSAPVTTHGTTPSSGPAESYPDEVIPFTYEYSVSDDATDSDYNVSVSDDGTGVSEGSYSVALPDGRIQHVTYTANDVDGYVASVTYDGTASYPEDRVST